MAGNPASPNDGYAVASSAAMAPCTLQVHNDPTKEHSNMTDPTPAGRIDRPLIGAVYLIEPDVPFDRQRRDLANMAEKGMNLVVLWPPMSRWDAADGVSPAFDSVDRVMDTCSELGLRVILELEGQNPAFQFGPDFRFVPDMITVTDRYKHWLNYYHPAVDGMIVEFCRQVAGHFKDHPALWGYDLFNEVNFHSTDRYTVAAFRRWLADKYGEVRVLNRVWGRFYTSFEQVHPETFKYAYSMWSSLRPQLDWDEFRTDSIVGFIRRWGAAVREADPNPDHVLIADDSWAMTVTDLSVLANDDWKVSRAAEVFGLSVYPQSWGLTWGQDPATISQIYRTGVCAAAGKPVMISELQTHNQTALSANSSVFDELRLWTWQVFAHGAQGLVYWKWNPFLRGKQACGRGMTAPDGTPNDRATQAADCAAALAAAPAAFGPRRVYDSGVGLLYNPTCDKWCDLIMPEDNGLYRRSFAGWYRFLWERNITPAIIQPGDLAEGEWQHLKVLVAPMLAMLSREDAAALEAFCVRGGRIVADSRFAIVDENGEAYERLPGGLEERFGYKEVDFLSPYGDASWCCGQRFSVIEPAGAAEVARTSLGDVAACRTDRTLYLATPLGLDSSLANPAGVVEEFLLPAVDRMCEVIQRGGQVDVTISHPRGDDAPRRVLVCATSYEHKPAAVRVRIDVAAAVTPLWPEVDAQIEKDDDGAVLAFTVPPRSAAGFVIEA